MAFRVACIAKGERSPTYNSIVLGTRAEAEQYGSDLYSRWMGMESYTVEECPGEPTYTYHGRQLEKIPACVVCEQPSTCLCEVGGES